MGARPRRRGKGCCEPGVDGWGVWRVWACSSSSRLLGPARAERREGVRGKERRALGGARQTRGGVRVRGRTRQTEKDCNDTVGVRHVSTGPFGTVRWNPISLNARALAIPNLKRRKYLVGIGYSNLPTYTFSYVEHFAKKS